MAQRPTPWQRRMRRLKRHAGRAFAMFNDAPVVDERAEGPRVAAWQSRTEWPLAALAVLFLVGYALQVLLTDLSHAGKTTLDVSIWCIWALFGADFVIRVGLARRHLRYTWRHLGDLIIIALPMLRPLRVLRLLLLMRMLSRRFADALRGRVVVYGALTAALLIFCASLAVLQAERGHHGNIESFGDAIWWSFVTICTVGYGDRYPVTFEGRVVGVGLMVSGVGLFGVVTAAFAAWLVDSLRDEDAEEDAQERQDIAALRTQLDRIEASLVTLGATVPDLVRDGHEQVASLFAAHAGSAPAPPVAAPAAPASSTRSAPKQRSRPQLPRRLSDRPVPARGTTAATMAAERNSPAATSAEPVPGARLDSAE